MLLLAHGADVNYVNEEDYNRTPVHTAVIQAMSIAMMFDMDDVDATQTKEIASDWKSKIQTSLNILECLALNSANLDVQDTHGRTPMHYAADDEKGSHVMNWLVVRKARSDICDTLVHSGACQLITSPFCL
jgi:ankyrin repeat protein